MTSDRSTGRTGRRAVGSAVVLGLLALLSPDRAEAHFILDEPASWQSQDVIGSPQKLGPCGDETGGTPSGSVTVFQAGQTITVTVREIIFHPGHYRIALAPNDRSELPPEPTVTPAGSPCGSVPIQSPPVFPVLADGVFAHTRPFSGPQTVQITLPSNVTCTHCTLQVIEFMSSHPLNNPGGCFYHHCADIAIQAASMDGGTPDAGAGADAPVDTSSATDVAARTDTPPAPDAGSVRDAGVGDAGVAVPGSSATSSAGCGCTVTGEPPRAVPALGGLLALGLFARRRRRSHAPTATARPGP